MNIETFLAHENEKFLNFGCTISKEYYQNLKNKLLYYEHSNYKDVVQNELQYLKKQLKSIQEIIYGMILGIQIDEDEFTIIQGTTCKKEEIKPHTLFDVSSITKMFTFLLALKLKEEGILNFDESIDLYFPQLNNVTVLDLLKMKGEFRTLERLENLSKKKAEENIMKTYLLEEKKYVYSDIPFILLSKIIEYKVSEKKHTSLSFEEILNQYVLKPYHLEATYHYDSNIAGNGGKDGCYDPKANLIGPTGSAGLFVSSEGFFHLSNQWNQMLKKEQQDLLTQKLYSDVSRGYAGLYQKYSDFSKTYVPHEYSNNAFASEGSTGSLFIYDFHLNIQNHFLFDAIDVHTLKKHLNFSKELNTYQEDVTRVSLLLHLLSEYQKSFTTKEKVKIMIK